MKKNFKNALFGAIALTGLVGFYSCSSSEEEVVDNPNYDPATNSVNAQFAFNIATSNSQTPSTRMTEANTQGDGDHFRGIQDTKIQVFQLAADGSYVSGTGTSATKSFDLGVVLGPNQVSTSGNTSHRVLELSLPLGSNTLMFYGRASKGTGSSDEIGNVVYSVNDNPANTSFALTSRLGSNKTDFNNAETLLAGILTRIAQTGLEQEAAGTSPRDLRYAFYWNSSTGKATPINLTALTAEQRAALPANGGTGTGEHAGEKFYIGTKYWYEYGEAYAENVAQISLGSPAPNNLIGLEENLGEAFYAFTSVNNDNTTVSVDPDGTPDSGDEYTRRIIGVRAGSGPAIAATIKDLAAIVKKVKDATATGVEEEIAKLLAERIWTRLNTYFNNLDGNIEFQSISNLLTNYNSYTGSSLTAPVIIATMEEFPSGYELPAGGAQLHYSGTSGNPARSFSYSSSALNLGLGSELGKTDVENIMFPAEILYFGNSPIRVSDESHIPSDYPEGVTDWDTEAKWTQTGFNFTPSSHVTSATRSVAMMKDVQYGSSLLKTTVRYGAAKLKDNHKASHPTEADKEIDVEANANLFKLTGILIGGQNNEMGWNYLRKSAGGTFNYVIYDKDVEQTIPQYSSAGAKTAPNYTLVFDNYNSSLAANAQTPVYVALEFENTGAGNFHGQSNIVRSGGTFYIVGKLDPKDAAAITFPTNYPLPPYTGSGASTATSEAKRVFIQDYVTTADFVIGAESLKSAYVTVPDLRSSQISLGLSVNIQWQTGLSFPEVILGQD